MEDTMEILIRDVTDALADQFGVGCLDVEVIDAVEATDGKLIGVELKLTMTNSNGLIPS